MERLEISMDPISTATSDIRIYADGIDIALAKRKYREAADYVNSIRTRLDAIAGFIESEGSEISG